MLGLAGCEPSGSPATPSSTPTAIARVSATVYRRNHTPGVCTGPFEGVAPKNGLVKNANSDVPDPCHLVQHPGRLMRNSSEKYVFSLLSPGSVARAISGMILTISGVPRNSGARC